MDRLRILLFLRRQRARSWSAPAVGKRLGLAPSSAADGLDYLCRGNLIDVKVGAQALLFRYGPGTDHLDRTIALLERLYDERRADVVALFDSGEASASLFK